MYSNKVPINFKVLLYVNGIRIDFNRDLIRLKGIRIGLGSYSSSRIPTNSC